MALTFSRAALIEAAEAAIAEAIEKQVRYDAARELRAQQYETEWMKLGPARVRKLRDYLTTALKTGRPVRRSKVQKLIGDNDIDSVFFTEESDFIVNREMGHRPSLDTVEYTALVDMLKASTGDEISASQLRSVGFGNLNPLFKAVAKAKKAQAERPE